MLLDNSCFRDFGLLTVVRNIWISWSSPFFRNVNFLFFDFLNWSRFSLLFGDFYFKLNDWFGDAHSFWFSLLFGDFDLKLHDWFGDDHSFWFNLIFDFDLKFHYWFRDTRSFWLLIA